MIKKLYIRLKNSDEFSFMHDSRKDVRLLKEVCNCLIDKVNELVIEVNKLNYEKTKGSAKHE